MRTYTIIGGVNGVGKSSFTGVLKEEFLPGWAREKLEEFQGQNAGMGGMEMT